MNNKRYRLVIDYINILQKFLASYILISFVLSIAKLDTREVLRALFLLPVPFVSYYIGEKTKHLWTYLVLHFLLCGIYIGATYLSVAGGSSLYVFSWKEILKVVIYILYFVMVTILTFQQRLKEELVKKSNTSPVLMVTFLLMNLYCNYQGLTFLGTMSFVFAIIYILFFLLNLYLINFEHFFRSHSEVANVPISQIKITNHTMIFLFGGFGVIVMLLFAQLPIRQILNKLRDFLLWVLKHVISLFDLTGTQEVSEKADSSAEQVAGELGGLIAEESKHSALWYAIQDALILLMKYIVILALVLLIAFAIYKIYQFFYSKKTKEMRDKVEFVSPFEKKEKLNPIPKLQNGKAGFNFFAKSNSEKVRKYFYKSVIKHIDEEKKLSDTLTPIELSEYALSNEGSIGKEEAKEERKIQLTAYYEKARYSKEECSKEDVQTVKHMLK
ncbi:MAG: hypothetical protein WBI07_11380 [Mobilitalea sp.]